MSKNDDFNQDEIETAFYNAVFGNEGQKINIGGLKIWMTSGGNILNYKITAPSEINEGILSILAAMSLMNDITLEEKILPVEDDGVRIINYLYRLIESSDFEPVDYIKDLIEKSSGKFDVNMVKPGYELPLIYALKHGTTLDMIQCLVEDFECNINILDQDGYSPLYHAYNMKKTDSFKSKIVEYLIEVKASLAAVEESQLIELSQSTNMNDHILALERLHGNDDKLTVKETFKSNLNSYIEQVALNVEVERLQEEKKILENLARTSIDKAIKGEKDIQFEDTNFILNRNENGKLDVLYNVSSEVFASLSKIAIKQEIKLEFVYDKHPHSNIEEFNGNSYEDLITQVLQSDKSLFVSQTDLILQKNESNIECFCGRETFEKLKILYDITVQMGLAPTYEELGYYYVMPEEVWLAGEMDLPD